MDDFTAWLENELRNAAHQPNRQQRRLRLDKTRSLLAVAASIVVVIVIAGGAILALASHNHGQKPANVSTHRHPHTTVGQLPPSVAALARRFAVLRGPMVKLPPQVSQVFGDLDAALERAQAHRVSRPEGTVWIVPESDGPCTLTKPGTRKPAGAPCGSGGLCIAFTEPGARAPAGGTCGDFAEAERGGIRMTMGRLGLAQAAGVAPDGISAAKVNFAGGATFTVPVEHNVYAATGHGQITSVHLIPAKRVHSQAPAFPNAVRIADLPFVPAPPKVRMECQQTANAVGYAVPCPTMLPKGLVGTSAGHGCPGFHIVGWNRKRGCGAIAWHGWIVGNSQVYRGIRNRTLVQQLDLQGAPSVVHNPVIAIYGPGPTGQPRNRLRVQPRGNVRISGQLMHWYYVPNDAYADMVDHLALVWTAAGHTYAYGFQVMGPTTTTLAGARALDLELVRHLTTVHPQAAR